MHYTPITHWPCCLKLWNTLGTQTHVQNNNNNNRKKKWWWKSDKIEPWIVDDGYQASISGNG